MLFIELKASQQSVSSFIYSQVKLPPCYGVSTNMLGVLSSQLSRYDMVVHGCHSHFDFLKLY